MVKVQWGMPPEAEAIRRTVFIEEQAFVEEFDALDDLALHLVVYDDDVPVGTARVFRIRMSRRFTGLGALLYPSGRGKAVPDGG